MIWYRCHWVIDVAQTVTSIHPSIHSSSFIHPSIYPSIIFHPPSILSSSSSIISYLSSLDNISIMYPSYNYCLSIIYPRSYPTYFIHHILHYLSRSMIFYQPSSYLSCQLIYHVNLVGLSTRHNPEFTSIELYQGTDDDGDDDDDWWCCWWWLWSCYD